MTEQEQQQDSPVPLPECGERLRRTREHLGLSVDDIASELRLSSFQIRALEDDDWSQLPGTTYARGYVKAYARLLGLDAEQMLAGASTEEIEISRTSPQIEAAGTEDDTAPADEGRIPWGWVLGVGLVCAVLAGLWQAGGKLERVPGFVEGEIGALGAGSGRPPGTSTQTVSSPKGQTAPATEADDLRVGAGSAQASSAHVSVGTGASGLPPTPTKPNQVVFQFNERSWIEVRDGRGNRLLYRSYDSGRRIEIDGQPPFHVFLGNAPGVSVEYLGKVSKPAPTSGRLYARFVLGTPTG